MRVQQLGHLTRGTNEVGGNCGEGVEGRGVVDKEGGGGAIIRGSGWLL